MNQPLTLTASYMSHHGRTVRHRPTETIPTTERYEQAERLLVLTWELAQSLGMATGPRPHVVTTGIGPRPIETLLGVLVSLETEVLATFLMLGLGTAYDSGLYELGLSVEERRVPDFRRIIDDLSENNNPEWEENDVNV